MSDHAATSINKALIDRERQIAHAEISDTRMRLEVLGEDLRTKGDHLVDCTASELLMFAMSLEKVALDLRSCAVTLNSATMKIAEQIMEQARLRGHEI